MSFPLRQFSRQKNEIRKIHVKVLLGSLGRKKTCDIQDIVTL